MAGERKMVVELDSDLLKRLKLRAVQKDTTLKALVETALNQFLAGQKGGTHD